MMTPTQQDTARALSKHPRFKWMRGMSMLRDAPGKADNLRLEVIVTHGREELDGIPDLADPATIGAIGALARSIYEHTMLVCFPPRYETEDWGIEANGKVTNQLWRRLSTGPTQGEAWANLILSLPHA